MSKRILSVVLALALLLTTVSVTGILTTAAVEPIVTYNADEVASNLTPAADPAEAP